MVTYCMSRSEHNRDQCVTKLRTVPQFGVQHLVTKYFLE